MSKPQSKTWRDVFHRHLDTCPRCRQSPMDLCPMGAVLLRAAALYDAPAPPAGGE
jgi:hypothetical protein